MRAVFSLAFSLPFALTPFGCGASRSSGAQDDAATLGADAAAGGASRSDAATAGTTGSTTGSETGTSTTGGAGHTADTGGRTSSSGSGDGSAAGGSDGSGTGGTASTGGESGNRDAGATTNGGAGGTTGRDAGGTATRDAGATNRDAGSVGETDAGDPCGPGNPAVVPLPTIGAGAFDVTTYGAVGDGKTVATPAIQAALSAAGAAGGGTVTIPSGTFLSGPVVVSSGTRLELASGATLKMLPMSSYPSDTAFITANNAHDIALTGSGTIEGQGQAWWNALTDTPDLQRPQEVSFSNSTRVLISGIRLQNSPEEHIWVKGDTDVTITGITISTLAVSGQHAPNNTDGVDIGANGVFFCNNDIACGDDNVVMSGSNIYVAYSNFGVGHGCSIGSITQKGVSAVTVDHVTMNGTTSGIRMKSARDRGGLVQNLTYSNITMTNVQNPVYVTSYYPSLPADPVSDAAQAITATTPQWKNITIKNVTVTGSSNGGILWGLPEEKISGLIFDNVRIQANTGMEIFHAGGVSFTGGSTVTPKSGAAVTTYDADVTGIATSAYK